MRTFVSGKIHHLRVTEAELHYIGSVTIDADILKAANIQPYEQVDIVNLSNGERWTTYALPGKPQVFSLNGGGARSGRPGDICIIMAYQQAEHFTEAPAVIIDSETNRIKETLTYPITSPRPEDAPSVKTS